MHGASLASIIKRNCFGSLTLLARQLAAPVVTAQMQSGKFKVVVRHLYLRDGYEFYVARINCSPISGKPGQSMVPHLSKCIFVAPDVKAHAIEEINEKRSRRREDPGPALGRSVSMPLLPIITTGLDQVHYPTPGWSGSATLSPMPSPLLLSTPLVNIDRPTKRPRTSSFMNPDGSGSSSPVARVWNPHLQQEFGEDFCKFLIATRSAWNFASNPQVHLFFDKWIPGAIVPDRRTLSGPILDREAGKVEEKLKLKLKGRKATFQTDGWKNIAKQAIIATMVSVDFEVSARVQHFDMSDEILSDVALSDANS